jgi:leucyl/phenylalanyl-tRNA--protein transferase
MNIALLHPGMRVPDSREIGPSGLVAIGGDLHPETLIDAYSKGAFPWFEEEPILWFSPDPRLVLRLAELRIGRSIRRALKREEFEVRLDTAFEEVIRSCAEVPRPGQAGTWINPDMIDAYIRLHDMGLAHSAEAWCDGRLVGGLYCVSLGAVFYGESMFSAKSDASKVALVQLVRQLISWDFQIIDCQIHTRHVARLGATEWPRRRFLRALKAALRAPTRRGKWALDPAEQRSTAGPEGIN